MAIKPWFFINSFFVNLVVFLECSAFFVETPTSKKSENGYGEINHSKQTDTLRVCQKHSDIPYADEKVKDYNGKDKF